MFTHPAVIKGAIVAAQENSALREVRSLRRRKAFSVSTRVPPPTEKEEAAAAAAAGLLKFRRCLLLLA